MKITIQHSDDRGVSEYQWLQSKHSFSFANYYNPEKMGFGLLRVLNEDIVEPGKGFGMHHHNNMEIVSIVIKGTLEHRDSLGNHGVIPAGEIQRISAGTGITHSEVNNSSSEQVHFLQIWIQPLNMNVKPSYEQKSFRNQLKKNKLTKVVSWLKSDKTIHINQETQFFIGTFDKNKMINYKPNNKEHGIYIFVIKGCISIDSRKLMIGDAAEIIETKRFGIKTNENTEILMIEVPLYLK